VEGFSSGTLRIIDLETQSEVRTEYLADRGLTSEPELICLENGTLYYAGTDGTLRVLSLDGMHFHDYTASTTAPTCTEKGYTTYTCACGDSYVADYTDPTGHSFTDYVSDGNASCKADGTETAKCDHSCGKTDTRTDKDSKLDHKYEDGKCILCGASQETPKTGDSGNLFPWAELLILSAMALFFLLFWKQREKEEA
jgi:LPXTG-motif cell wall-anchored protein